jgi:hypothetical protein
MALSYLQPVVLFFAAIYVFAPMFLPFPFQMAKFIQLLTSRRKTISRRFAMARQEKQQHVARLLSFVLGSSLFSVE